MRPNAADQTVAVTVPYRRRTKTTARPKCVGPRRIPSLRPIKGELDLLTIAPEVWDFDKADATSILSIDPESRKFSTASSYGGLFAWPVQMPKRFRWECRLSYSQDGTELALGLEYASCDRRQRVERLRDRTHCRLENRNHALPESADAEAVGKSRDFSRSIGRSRPLQLTTVDGSTSGDVIDVDMLVNDGALQHITESTAFSLTSVDPRCRHSSRSRLSVQPALFVGPGRLTVLSSKITALDEAN